MAQNIAFGDVTPATRLVGALAAGAVAGWLVQDRVPHASWTTAVLAGWSVTAAVYTAWSWMFLWRLDADQTRAHVMREEPTRPVSEALVFAACTLSLVGIVVVLLGHSGPGRDVALAAGFGAVVMSWLALNTLLAVRYALSWYAEPVGGIDFNQAEPPQYSDFAYLSMTVAMSFAVSDPDVTDSPTRRLVLSHALLSYLFGTFLVALLVNVVAGL